MRTTTIPLTLVIAASLALAGCGDKEDSADAADASGSPAAASTASPGADASASATPAATDDSIEAQIAADCPAGRWQLDNDSWADLVRSKFAAEGSLDSVDGDVLLTLGADGTYSEDYREWTMTMSSGEGTAVITRDGTDTGTWADIDGHSVLTAQEPNSAVTGYVESPRGASTCPRRIRCLPTSATRSPTSATAPLCWRPPTRAPSVSPGRRSERPRTTRPLSRRRSASGRCGRTSPE